MPTKLFVTSFVLASALVANSAEAVYLNSARFLSFENLKFDVSSVTTKNGNSKNRSFLVAKRTEKDGSSLLMRFKEPRDIKCTAVLLKKEGDISTNYLYLPSLNRTRIIPQSKKGSEVFGLGISYSELNAEGGEFKPLEEFVKDGVKYFKVTRVADPMKSEYIINSISSEVESIKVYRGEILEKEILMDKVIEIDKVRLITEWRINDFKKGREISYSIDKSSISSKVNASLFRKNRLSRCVF